MQRILATIGIYYPVVKYLAQVQRVSMLGKLGRVGRRNNLEQTLLSGNIVPRKASETGTLKK